MKRVIYRDRQTGQFASKSTWKRSQAQGGKRFARQSLHIAVRLAPKKEEEKEEEAPRPVRPIIDLDEFEDFISEAEDEDFEDIEFEGALDYARKGRR